MMSVIPSIAVATPALLRPTAGRMLIGNLVLWKNFIFSSLLYAFVNFIYFFHTHTHAARLKTNTKTHTHGDMRTHKHTRTHHTRKPPTLLGNITLWNPYKLPQLCPEVNETSGPHKGEDLIDVIKDLGKQNWLFLSLCFGHNGTEWNGTSAYSVQFFWGDCIPISPQVCSNDRGWHPREDGVGLMKHVKGVKLNYS